MFDNRNKLEERVEKFLSEIKTSGKSREFIEELSKKNVPHLQINKILARGLSLKLISDAFLMTICVAINEINELGLIKLTDYFTEVEIKQYSKWKYKRSNSTTITFEKVRRFPNTTDQFKTFLHVKDIINMFDRGQLNYNFDTQRDAIIRIEDNQIYKTININEKAVDEIAELLIKGEFIPNGITLNILRDGTEEITYNEIEETLTIKSGELDVLDGMHRTLGLYRALKNLPTLDVYFEINIMNFDVVKAKRYIVQEDKKNPISKEHIKTLSDDSSSVLLDLIKSQSKDFKQYIAPMKEQVDYKRYVISEVHFREFVDYVFTLKTARDAHKIASSLIMQLDNWIGYVMEKQKRGRSRYFTQYSFIGFLQLFELKGDKVATDKEIDDVFEYLKTIETRNITLKQLGEMKETIQSIIQQK